MIDPGAPGSSKGAADSTASQSSERRLRIYLAGPDVFFPNAIELGKRKKRICAKYGFDGLFPLDNELAQSHPSKAETARTIFKANCQAMDNADLVIANMMPFRGPSTDAGTAFEMGYMFAQGKPVFGYGGDGRTYLQRVLFLERREAEQSNLDARGMHIEDFDLPDNLMLVCAMSAHQVEVVRYRGEWTDLSAFEECVRFVASRQRSNVDRWRRRHRGRGADAGPT